MPRARARRGSRADGRAGRGRCSGLNERLRFLRYDPGHFFRPHTDGSYAVRPLPHPTDGSQPPPARPAACPTPTAALLAYICCPAAHPHAPVLPAG
jgi:hypothetical protein